MFKESLIRRAEYGVSLLATAVILLLHTKVLIHAGALWRDEVNTFDLATMDTLSKIWSLMEHDSYPGLWFMVLRAWIKLGLGSTDFQLRILGLIIGLGIVVALWWNAWIFGRTIPLLSLLLFGMSPSLLRIGDSLRGYGLGVLLMLLMIGANWRMVECPTWTRALVAGSISLLAVQTLYYNCIILGVVCLAVLAVCIWTHAWGTITKSLMIGFLCAFSIVPYLPSMIRLQQWNILFKLPINLPWVGYKFNEAVSSFGSYTAWLWAALIVLSVHFSLRQLLFKTHRFEGTRKPVILFLVILVTMGTVAYTAFLLVLSYPTEPWYYLSLMGLLALSIDGLLYVMTSVNTNWRLGRLVVFLLVLSLGLTNVWQAVMTRQTNVDLIAEEIEGRISKRDLIIVNPWFLGITFLRYHSKGDWETLPRLNDHRITQYEEIKKIMTKVDPIVKDLNRMALVLKGGGDIWWVGNLPPYVPGLTSDPLPPAPLPETGWREGPYHEDWSKQARDMFHQHGCRITKIPVTISQPINSYENVDLHLISGWS